MTDADGNFYIYLGGSYGLNNLMTNGIVQCSFSINQRIIDKSTGLSCVPFMTEIANSFQCKIYHKIENAIVFIANANNKHYLIKKYFDKFPLMSSKHLNYLSYLDGLNYLGKHLTNEEIINIQAIKNSMNDKRTYFN
jgi:LAGLIDADG endonuclease